MFSSLAFAGAAQAAIVTGTFSGTVLGGIDIADLDGNGYFTTNGGDLSGLAITGSFTYDTDLAPDTLVPGEYGGAFPPADWLDFSVKVNNVTYNFGSVGKTAGNTQSATVIDGPPDSFLLLFGRGVAPETENISIDLFDPDDDFITGTDLPESFTYTSTTGGIGSFLIQTGDAQADVLFSIESASAQVAPIPEPLVWVQLIAGFALVGGIIRGRRTPAPSRA